VQVVWQNENWLVVDKPPEWLTVPSRQGEADERPCLGKHLEKKLNCRLWPVHRLDFEVSGLVLFAFNADAHRVANAWFEKHQVQKTYEALSLGPVPSEFLQEQEWKCKLVRGKRRSFVADHGLESVTRAKSIGAVSAGHWLWELQPLTGRSHQLRVEMFRHGFAIVGDELYGGAAWSKPGIALRAHKLNFKLIGEEMRMGLPEVLNVFGIQGN